MTELEFRVVRKLEPILSTTVNAGRISERHRRELIEAVYFKYRTSEFGDVVEGYLNRGSRKQSYFGRMEPHRFFDPERKEQGFYFGDPDCLVIAAEKLSVEEVNWLLARQAENRGQIQ